MGILVQRKIIYIASAIYITVVYGAVDLSAQETNRIQPIDIGERLELFVDQYLIDKFDGVELRMHKPTPMPLPKNPLPVAYTTVIKDGDVYRAYYRDYIPGYSGSKRDGNPGEITCYAESRDGHEWMCPNLGISEVKSSRGSNVILADASPYSHNFSPFLDKKPGIDKQQRFKALPTRFVPDRGESTDILFMASRAGSTVYERLFTEAFIRPGLDADRWGNRANYVAHNVVPTSSTEMSIYHRSGHRYLMRTDGFISVRAGATKGELLTKPLIFAGSALIVNYSTSAVGGLQVEIQEVNGNSISGFHLDDCPVIIGDKIEHHVQWKGDSNLSELAGKPVRLRFVMTECDLYSFRFQSD